MPASQKVCGFTAHNSKHGCPKCNKELKTDSVGVATDYSGLKPHCSRNPVKHSWHVEEILAKPTQELTLLAKPIKSHHSVSDTQKSTIALL